MSACAYGLRSPTTVGGAGTAPFAYTTSNPTPVYVEAELAIDCLPVWVSVPIIAMVGFLMPRDASSFFTCCPMVLGSFFASERMMQP